MRPPPPPPPPPTAASFADTSTRSRVAGLRMIVWSRSMAWDISADRPLFSGDEEEYDDGNVEAEVMVDKVEKDADFFEELVDVDIVVFVVVGRGEGIYCISPSYNSSIDA